MKICDFIKEQQKKNKRAVVLTDSIHNVNKLIERIAMSGEKVINVDVKRPIDIAIDILNTYNARKGVMNPIVEPNIEVGSIFIDEIIRDKKNGITFCPKESLCKKTCIEILNNINLIRLNKATDEYENTKEKKILEIKKLVKLYERKLEENELYDETRIFNEAIELYKKDKSLFDINLEYYQILFNEECNLRTKEFVDIVFADKIIELDNEFSNSKNKVTFKKYYGMFTEVYNTLDDIIKKNLKFGDVEIMFTSPEYIPYLKSIFGENKVKINFVSGYSALSNNYIKLFYDMLNFAKNGFIYQDFKKVAFNKLINIKNVQSLFLRAINNGLNFGIEQFKNFIKKVDAVNEKNKNDDDKKNLFEYKAEYVEFLRAIVEVFDDKMTNAHKIYEAVLEILDKYTSNYKEKRDGREKLHAMRDTIKFIKNPENIDEMLDAILDETNRLIFNDAEENNAITVDLFDGYKVINRKNVYVLGLSSKHYNIKTTESPVLSDEERKTYLDNKTSYIELNSDKPINSEKKIISTLNAFDNANVTISMTYFDVLEHMELAESTLYSSLLDMHGNPKVLSVDKYPNIIENDYKFDKKRFFNEKIKKVKADAKEEKEDEEDIDKLKEKNEENSKFDESGYVDKKADVIEKYFSASSLDTLKSCPLNYHYAKEAKIQEEEYVVPSDSEWLDAAEKGTFVHSIFEYYVSNCFKDKGTKVSKNINEKEFELALKKAKDEIIDKHPIDSEYMAKKIIKDCSEKAKEYIERLHKEISDKNNKWNVISTEFYFGGEEYVKKYKIKDKIFNIHYNGRIDRADGYTDENGIEHIRIIDYKTGRLDKEKYDNSPQQHIYSEYFKSKGKEVDEFIYEFVFDETDSDHRLVYKDEELADPIEKFELEELLYDVFVDGKYITEGLAYDPNGGCKWCKYKDICLVRIKEDA